MKKKLFLKTFTLSIIILLFGASFIPVTLGIIKQKTSLTSCESRGYIQDLIDNSSDGDIIHIPSGVYYENIIINKSINLIGQDKNNTIIDANFYGNCVTIVSNWVNISGFTIRYSVNYYYGAGIYIESSNNTISDNIITNNNPSGILLLGNNNIIIRNIITNNSGGYYGNGITFYGDNNKITDNIIFNDSGTGWGWGLAFGGMNNTISYNSISKNIIGIGLNGEENIIFNNNISESSGVYGGCGIMLSGYSNTNTFFSNNIINNDGYGIQMDYDMYNNTFYNNNFINNTINAEDAGNNFWDNGKKGNYWGDYEEKYPDARKRPFFGVWDTPYNISGGVNKDNFPLIKPFNKPRNKAFSVPLQNFLEHYKILYRIVQNTYEYF